MKAYTSNGGAAALGGPNAHYAELDQEFERRDVGAAYQLGFSDRYISFMIFERFRFPLDVSL